MLRPLALVFLLACGGDDSTPTVIDTHDTCGGVITTVPTESGIHVDQGTPIDWNSNPPTSGPHFQIWAGYDRHYASLPRGNWVHDLEHGAIVFAYRCDAGCDDVAGQLDDLVRALPDDSACIAPVHHRALVVADPLLPQDMTVTAIAWGHFYSGSCVDADSLAAFYADHHGRAPEDLCGDGAALGGVPLY